MIAKTVTVDKSGQIKLPLEVLEALGLHSDTEAIVELSEGVAVIKPKHATSITERIASMGLPVSDWSKMEQEIEAGLTE